MTTPGQLGLDTPTGNDLIRDGDDNISKNAEVLAQIYDQMVDQIARSPERMGRHSIPEGTDLTDFARHPENNGYWHVGPQVGATVTGWPENQPRTPCVVEVHATNTAATITVTEVGQSYSWVGTSLSQVWQGWRMTRPARTTQAVQLVTPVSGYQTSTQARNHRIPFRLPVSADRFRIHIANRNDADDVTYNVANLRINQEIFIGRHKLEDGQMTGQFAEAPVGTGYGPGIWLSDSAERVSPWIDLPLEANTEYLFSYSFYNPDGEALSAGMATGWWNAATGAVDQVDGVTMNKHIQSPLMIWLEVDVPASTPTLAWIGDSLTVGREAEVALHDGPPWMHAMTHGVIPRLHAQAGSRFTDWTSKPTSPKWTRWAGVDRPSACIINLGSNDLFDFWDNPGNLVSTLTSRLAALVPLVRQHVCDRIYYATILPRNNREYSPEFLDARDGWNDYLRTLPHGAEGCFDLSAMVADPANPDRLRGIYDGGDMVHLNTAGYARVAQGLTGTVGTAR